MNVCENAAQTEFENLRWNEGRRIVEIGFLAEQLKSCQKCKTTPLHLKDCVGEIRYGFGSILKIKCICSHINTIYTGKQHRTEDKSENMGCEFKSQIVDTTRTMLVMMLECHTIFCLKQA